VWLIKAVVSSLVCLSCCAMCPSIVHYCGQWMATHCATVPLAHVNQLPLLRFWSAAVHESSHVSSAISSIQTFFQTVGQSHYGSLLQQLPRLLDWVSDLQSCEDDSDSNQHLNEVNFFKLSVELWFIVCFLHFMHICHARHYSTLRNVHYRKRRSDNTLDGMSPVVVNGDEKSNGPSWST